MFDIDEHLENADWAKKTDDTNKALFGQQEERPRMRTREEYARKDHHCGVDSDQSGCPRDEGGRFSSGSGGSSATIVDEPAIRKVEFTQLEAKEQLANLIEDGGFTYDPVGEHVPSDGFVVSTYPDLEQIIQVDGDWSDHHALRAAILDNIKKYVKEQTKTFANSDKWVAQDRPAYFGGWWDTNKGRVYLDLVTIADSHEEALELSKKHKQEAYFDLSTQTEHRVGAREEAEEAAETPTVQRPEGGDRGSDSGDPDGRDNGGDNGKEDDRTRITSTPEFKNWFGDSKVVDESGEPLVVHHGSVEKNLTRFDPRHTVEVEGAFFFSSDESVASDYTFERAYGDIVGDEPSGEVISSYLSLQNPLEYRPGNIHGVTKPDQKIVDAVEMGKAIEMAKEKGHDGLVIRNIDDTVSQSGYFSDIYVAFSPAQIKSVTGNKGSFDPNDPRINYAKFKEEDRPR